MPVEDACSTEEEAFWGKFIEAEFLCLLAALALADWYHTKDAVREECIENAVPDIPHIDQFDEFGFPKDAVDEAVSECIGNHPDVLEAWDVYETLQTECDIARDELESLLDELKSCQHQLNEGVPFA